MAVYNARWQKARKAFLATHPLCQRCGEAGRHTAATVVDHITPHKGNQRLMWDQSNWQPLCEHCHNSSKRTEESLGYRIEIGTDGLPIDGRHPFFRGSMRRRGN